MSNNINYRLKTEMGNTLNVLQKVGQAYSNLGKNVSKSNAGFAKAFTSIKKTNRSFTNLTKDVNRANKSLIGMNGSLLNLRTLIGTIGFYRLAQGLTQAISSAMDMIETANLFSVAMGTLAVETNKALVEISSITGLDLTNMQTAVGTFGALSRSMGLTSRASQQLSTTTYRLGLDLASLYNVNINQALQDLRSGLVGQSETVYKYGIDVTEAALKVEALNQGITKSVRNMSQGEKMALRYAVMIRQSSVAHGDFARTLEQPANQLRILRERFVTLGRSIGTIFIPMLQAILPWLNAIVQALINVANAIARIFGYDSSVADIWDFDSGVGGVAEDVSDLEDGLSGAGKEAKKLQGQLMGFDEINLWKEPSDDASAGGSAGTGAIAGGADLSWMEGLSYDSMFDKIKAKSDELVDAIMPALEQIFDIVVLIGGTLLGWKIANGVMSFLTNPMVGGGLLQTLGKIKQQLMGGQGINGLMLGWAGTIGIIIARFVDLIKENDNFRRGLDVLKEAFTNDFKIIKDTLSDLIPNFDGLVEFLDKFGLDWKDVGITILGVLMLLNPATTAMGIALLGFEALSIGVRGIGYASSDAIDDFDLFAEGISEATKSKLEPFMNQMDDLDTQLKTLSWGEIKIDQAIVDDIKGKLKEINGAILAELDADQNEALAKLDPLREAFGEEKFNELVISNKEYYDEVRGIITSNEEKILSILETAKSQGRELQEKDYAEIERLRLENNELALKHMSENATELEIIHERLKANTTRIELEKGQEIMKNAREVRDNTIADAETQYATIKLEADRMLEVGAINEEMYQDIIDSATKTKDETIADAEEQYSNIYDKTTEWMGDTAQYLDEETLEIRSKWSVWLENLKKDMDENGVNIKDGFEQLGKDIKERLGKDMEKIKTLWRNGWAAVGNFFIDIINGVIDGFESGINEVIDGVNKFIRWIKGIPYIGDKISVGVISSVSLDRISRIRASIPTKPMAEFASGGFPDEGQMFIAREAGAELVGNLGGRSAVVNNDQIVEAVSAGVYQAVASAMSVNSGGSGQASEVILEIDGTKLGRILLPKMNGESKRLGYKPILEVR